jgi:hypothetical protein
VNLCFQYWFCILKRELMCSLRMFLKFSSLEHRGLNSSNLSKKAIVILQLTISLDRLERFLDQSLRDLRRSLNLALMTWALLYLCLEVFPTQAIQDFLVYTAWSHHFTGLTYSYNSIKMLVHNDCHYYQNTN